MTKEEREKLFPADLFLEIQKDVREVMIKWLNREDLVNKDIISTALAAQYCQYLRNIKRDDRHMQLMRFMMMCTKDDYACVLGPEKDKK